MEFARQHMLTLTETAAHCGASAQTMKKWELKYGFPSARKIGHRVYYQESAVMAWLASPDRIRRGGIQTGEMHHNSYPKEFVAEALRMHTRGYSYDRIAARLGVSKPCVQKWINLSRRNQAPEDVALRF